MAEKKTIVESGKRKRAVARAIISKGKGRITLNNQSIETLHNPLLRAKIQEPLNLIPEEIWKNMDITITVNGGGVNGQAEAARLAMCRAIVNFTNDNKIKTLITDYDRSFLIADVRRKEMRKPNDSKARAARQKSYR